MEQVETEVSKFDNEEETEEEEDKKKKGKKGGKKEKKKKEEPVEISIPIPKVRPPETEPTLKIPGLKNLKLTSLTQKIIGCIVGEHVTAESPWTTISKVVVDENLYLHHESSDFLPVKDDLSDYADSTILVGYDPNFMPYEDEDFHRFYIAVTESARNEVLSRLEEEKRLAEERLKNSINKKILPWTSLGSEKEVDESIPRNTRPLIQLELETDIDELLKPVNFKDRNVEDAKDGYVRIGPGRQEFVGIPKLRIDSGIQAVPKVVPNTAQTDPGLPQNAWTQYLYDMTTVEKALEQSTIKELDPDYVFREREYLEKSLEYNEYFDLYLNDYPLLVLQEQDKEIPHKSVFEDYEAYTDVSHCKNKLISSVAWHPMWSGIVALAYSVAVRCVSSADIDLVGDEVSREVFSKNSVLLWSFRDALKPRLILQSPREVHTIAWSPVDPNILVGGCVSGQIIIWDLKGKLEAVEGQEYLTPDQQRYRLVMHRLIGWLQPQPPAQYVRPAALSNIQFSHSGRVTQVQWISPYFEWTENGQYVKTAVDEGKTSMQIISCGEDGTIRIWDLNRVPEDLGAGGKPKKRKARKRPSALTANVSPFKAYDRKIRPIYILYPELPSNRITIKLTALSIQTFPIKYELVLKPTAESSKLKDEETEEKKTLGDKGPKSTGVLPYKEEEMEVEEEGKDEESSSQKERESLETEKKMKESKTEYAKVPESKKEELKPVQSAEALEEDSIIFRRTYQPVMNPPVEQPAQLVHVVSDEGDSITVKWEGFDFHKGELITTEQGFCLSWGAAVHDGPVVACVRSPFISDLVLTVGGKVTALWKPELPNRPLFWKYSPEVVTCASWSPYRPCLFHVGRSDGSVEVWDLTRDSDSPILVQSISGKVLTTMSEHTLPLYKDQCVLGISDFNKSFRLLFFPEEYRIPKPNELETLKEFVNREVYVRLTYLEWNESFIKRNAEEIAKMKAKEEEAEAKRREAELAAEQEAQLRAKLEEEEAKQLAKGRAGNTLGDRFLERLKQEREKQMQRVLMEKKRLNKSELLAKQEPILMMKQMEKEKRKKQRDKIRQQQKIFDKTVAMLFPEVVEKPPEVPSRLEEFEAELSQYQSELMAQYDNMLPTYLKYIKDNPFNKRMRWEKVFEEGMDRRNILDFPLFLRQKRMERYMNSKLETQSKPPPGFEVKKVGFKDGEEGEEGEEEEEEEEVEEEEEQEAEAVEEESVGQEGEEEAGEQKDGEKAEVQED